MSKLGCLALHQTWYGLVIDKLAIAIALVRLGGLKHSSKFANERRSHPVLSLVIDDLDVVSFPLALEGVQYVVCVAAVNYA